MDYLFNNPYYTPRSHYYSPTQHPNPPRHYSFRNKDAPVQPQSVRAPKVVSIPVHYAAPERSRNVSDWDAALMIQRAFRGHLVRKSVSKIARIKREVDEISERVSKKETMDLVRTDAKERLRVVETLMSLLLKLDSVKGVDSGVRDLRKAVIKKAIALQETVEASAANHQTPCGRELPKQETALPSEANDQTPSEHDELPEHETVLPSEANDQTPGGHESPKQETYSSLESMEESGETAVNESSMCDSSESKKSNEGLLKKMAEENERMVGLVTELVHRNEKQSRLLGTLSHRVEMLERALINERLRKKKKRRHALDCREEFF